MSSESAIITSIQRASTHDGPGIRTTVFFKGCPLNCAWCHNPECINPLPEIMFYPEKCINCGMCREGCYSGARVICGKEMTVNEILSEILLDKDYYSTDGGVTFSGGEPLMQKDALLSLLKMCKAESINTAIETSLFLFSKEIFELADFVMADFKIFDSQKHKKYVGADNIQIKENFKKLDACNTKFIVRTPVIAGINDTKEETESIKNFVLGLKNAVGYELLPYHPLGRVKAEALGKETAEFRAPTPERMKELERYAYFG